MLLVVNSVRPFWLGTKVKQVPLSLVCGQVSAAWQTRETSILYLIGLNITPSPVHMYVGMPLAFLAYNYSYLSYMHMEGLLHITSGTHSYSDEKSCSIALNSTYVQ